MIAIFWGGLTDYILEIFLPASCTRWSCKLNDKDAEAFLPSTAFGLWLLQQKSGRFQEQHAAVVKKPQWPRHQPRLPVRRRHWHHLAGGGVLDIHSGAKWGNVVRKENMGQLRKKP